ncbi:MAG: hypothetical protein ACK58T_11765, partial [Phycisphaerae bacterium]
VKLHAATHVDPTTSPAHAGLVALLVDADAGSFRAFATPDVRIDRQFTQTLQAHHPSAQNRSFGCSGHECAAC